jgi:hypothetical protein
MGFLSRLFGGKKTASGSPPAPTHGRHGDDELLSTVNDVECPHIDLGPHWENAADMGKMDKVTGFQCGGCRRIFSRAEAEALREQEPERLAWMKEGDQSTWTEPGDPSPSGRTPNS